MHFINFNVVESCANYVHLSIGPTHLIGSIFVVIEC